MPVRRPGDSRSHGPDRRARPAALFAALELRSQATSRSPGRSCSEIDKRLEFLDDVGLDYLTLDRPADTLSGGELQRVRLATGIGSGLVGVCYVLDEPSIGLHPRDNQRLIDALRRLAGAGQHRAGGRARRSDHAQRRLAGRHRARRRAARRPDRRRRARPSEVAAIRDSLTGRYLSRRS